MHMITRAGYNPNPNPIQNAICYNHLYMFRQFPPSSHVCDSRRETILLLLRLIYTHLSQHPDHVRTIVANSSIHHDMHGRRTQRSSERSFRNQLHVVIMFLITTLGSYVQAEYQAKGKSLFDDHALVTVTIMVSICLYGVSLIAEYELQSQKPYLAIIKTFGPLVGFLVIVLLLIILVPLLGKITSIIWVFFILKAAIMWFPKVVQRRLCEVFSGIRQYLVSEPSHSQGVHANDSPV